MGVIPAHAGFQQSTTDVFLTGTTSEALAYFMYAESPGTT
jgi:hypothetical protein